VTDQYRVRAATLDDADALVRHRIGMFTDMNVPLDAAALDRAFRGWLARTMPAGTYRAWVVDAPGRDGESSTIVAGGGLTVLPWPPGPHGIGERLAFVYNVFTEAPHRRRGLARLIMNTMHDWCRQAGIALVALNASGDARPLYESMGYQVAPYPMMFLQMGKV
jgi:GNAT superfamily N-acetyltransferase